jgi:hypothetical protein
VWTSIMSPSFFSLRIVECVQPFTYYNLKLVQLERAVVISDEKTLS